MAESVNLIPKTIFCPKCGQGVRLTEMRDPLEVMKLIESEYSQGARGQCPCGLILVFLTRALPANPTFTMLFNVYEGGE